MNTQADSVSVGAWLPIESAPKDGRPIDLWVVFPDGGRRWPDASWQEQHNCTGPANWATRDGWPLHGLLEKPVATHWMAPPKAPTSMASSEGEPVPADPDEAMGWRANKQGVGRAECRFAGERKERWERGHRARSEWKKAGQLPQPQPKSPASINEAAREIAEREWTGFLDANPDDITSPEEWPDHALITFDQAWDYLIAPTLTAALSRSTSEVERERDEALAMLREWQEAGRNTAAQLSAAQAEVRRLREAWEASEKSCAKLADAGLMAECQLEAAQAEVRRLQEDALGVIRDQMSDVSESDGAHADETIAQLRIAYDRIAALQPQPADRGEGA